MWYLGQSVSLPGSGWPVTHCVEQASLKLRVIFPLPALKHKDHRWEPPHRLGKRSTNPATAPANSITQYRRAVLVHFNPALWRQRQADLLLPLWNEIRDSQGHTEKPSWEKEEKRRGGERMGGRGKGKRGKGNRGGERRGGDGRGGEGKSQVKSSQIESEIPSRGPKFRKTATEEEDCSAVCDWC